MVGNLGSLPVSELSGDDSRSKWAELFKQEPSKTNQPADSLVWTQVDAFWVMLGRFSGCSCSYLARKSRLPYAEGLEEQPQMDRHHPWSIGSGSPEAPCFYG